MHEYSIVQALLDQCEREAKKADASKILSVRVKVGKLSGVEPKLLKTAFEFFSEDSLCKGAKLEINVQNVVVECRRCGEKSELGETEFCCPKCRSEDITIVDGEELMLMSLTMQ
ncbi:MAG: hydrogenase maturation nickel metallochaperone HypA [Helicobacteraceae bacterium]|jgi:hydrogenase nickel incorporation protein HypA/HybF|nr:hydrogenase maturation nickel metallochaperone HypA [Helicobacteraceae bacterium]